MNKLQIVSKRLDGLKGVILLRTDGEIYFLKGYSVSSKSVKGIWPFTNDRQVEYISSLTYTSTGPESQSTSFFEHGEIEAVVRATNVAIDARKRYFKMLSALGKLGYSIKKNVPTLFKNDTVLL